MENSTVELAPGVHYAENTGKLFYNFASSHWEENIIEWIF